MKHTALAPIGVEITDLDLAAPDADDVAQIKELLAEHGVAVFPRQRLDDDEFTALLERFGDLVFTAGETPVPGHPDLNVISNVGRETPPTSTFHVDSSYFSTPPAYTALRTVSIPEQGGETLFTNQYAAYDSLPDEVRERLDGRTITHVVTGVDPALLDEGDETSSEHPVFRPHPLSGRTALYLSTPRRCAAISGLDDAEAAEVVRFLYEHSTRDDNTLRHAWAPDDVVMWDNGCVLHRADHSGVVGDRVMHRGMVL